jgi:DNA-3-methyladenine glycosylase II
VSLDPPDTSAAAVAHAAEALAARDADLARLLQAHGPPPAWHRGPGFRTLVHIVLGQQVSLASARSALDRLERTVGRVTPSSLVTAGEGTLRAAGLTRQKSRYLVDLGSAVVDRTLDLDGLAEEPDATVVERLTALRGIGRWTADIYLLMALGRPDVWPSSDLALIVAARAAKGLPADASASEVARLADTWRPFRSTAARMLWHDYLMRRGRPLDD